MLSAPILSQEPDIFESQHHNFKLVSVATGLSHPWSMAFLDNGDLLVTERPGRLRIIRDGNLLAEPVGGLPEVRVGGHGGLQEVLPHPNFISNHLLYLSYAKANNDGSEGTTVVVSGRLEDDRLEDIEEIFEASAWTEGRGHHGAKLAFGGEYLFVTVGDRQSPPRGDLGNHPAQDFSSHFVK